jgi:hypothetical protein
MRAETGGRQRGGKGAGKGGGNAAIDAGGWTQNAEQPQPAKGVAVLHSITSRTVSDLVLAVSARPDPTGLPGGAALQKLLNGLMFMSLLACAALVVFGGATWFLGGREANFTASVGGRRAVLAGIVGALLIGAAAAIVNFFFAVGRTVR